MSDWDFLWGLEGSDLESAMTTGATYSEWQEINRRDLQEAMERGDEAEISEITARMMLQEHLYNSDFSEDDTERQAREKHQTELQNARLQRKLQKHRTKKRK